MADPVVLADLLVVAASIYRKQDFYSLDKELQDEAVQRLNGYGILSISSMGAIVGVSSYRVEKAIADMAKPSTRGHLNPQHLTMLLFSLSSGDIAPRWVQEMTDEGTSVSVIAELTGISESTIRRRKS